MSKYQQILIHIGYPKTASTWLQQFIFGDAKSGFCVPWGAQSELAKEQFIKPDSLHFSAEFARSAFEQGLHEADKNNLIPVISQEFLIGDPLLNRFSGKFWAKEIADRIHSTFPNALILIVIREQKSIVISSYRQHISMGGTATIQQFIGTGKEESSFLPICPLEFFDYDLVIDYYQKLFRADNIIVLPFEILKQNPKDFIENLVRFTGSKGIPNYSQKSKNVGYKGVRLSLQRQLNFFVSSKYKLTWRIACKLSAETERLLPPSLNDRIERSLEDFVSKRISHRFRESNQRTSRLIGMNLADLGYDC